MGEKALQPRARLGDNPAQVQGRERAVAASSARCHHSQAFPINSADKYNKQRVASAPNRMCMIAVTAAGFFQLQPTVTSALQVCIKKRWEKGCSTLP